jgi:hypothetical protein
VLFSTALARGEMLWFCRVLARAQEKDAKKWKFEKNLVQNAEFLSSGRCSNHAGMLAKTSFLYD